MAESDVLLKPDVNRVRYLCGLTDDAAWELCADPQVSDPLAVHCARFAIHLVKGTPLPTTYAWEVLRHSLDAVKDEHFSIRYPLEDYLRMMALYAADEPSELVDVAEFSQGSSGLRSAVAFRYTDLPDVLTDERLDELAESEDHELLRLVAVLLAERPHPRRVAILTRMYASSERRVRSATRRAILKSREPELIELMARNDDLYDLGWIGDRRARPVIKQAIDGDDPLHLEWVTPMVVMMRDRELLERLWGHHEWYNRANAYSCAIEEGILDEQTFQHILTFENETHLAELAIRWPVDHLSQLEQFLDTIAKRTPLAPTVNSIKAGDAEALNKARDLEVAIPPYCAAILRLLPEPVAERFFDELVESARPEVVEWVGWSVTNRELDSRYPVLAELCVHEDPRIADHVATRVRAGAIGCCLFGIDTAVLKARDNFAESSHAKRNMENVVNSFIRERKKDQHVEA